MGGMRNCIVISNLIAAAGATCLAALALISSFSSTGALFAGACVVWTVSEAALLKARAILPWALGLVAVLSITLCCGAETLRLLSLLWRAEYGDRSVQLDPTTVGIPLFCSGLFFLAALLALLALASLPV